MYFPNEQIENKYLVLSVETGKYAHMYANFDTEFENVILYLRDFLKPQRKQDKFNKLLVALHELNYEVLHFCLYEKLLERHNQIDEKYISALISWYIR